MAFDEVGLVEPGRILLLDVGCAAASNLAFTLLAGCVALRREVVVVDGGNWLDAYRLGDAGERASVARDAVLESVRVARGFTAYQVQSLVERVPRLLGDDCTVGLVVAAALPEMYLDVDVKPEEARVLLERALEILRDVARERNVPVVVTNPTVAPRSRHAIRAVLEKGVDEVAGLHPAPHGSLVLRVPRRGVGVLMPPPGTRQERLDAYTPVTPGIGPEGTFACHLPDVYLQRTLHKLHRVSTRAGEHRAEQARRRERIVALTEE